MISSKTEIPSATLAGHAAAADDVRRIVAEISGVPVAEVRDDQSLFDDLAWDSLDVVECAMEIEETFDVSVPEDISDGMRTVRDLIEGVCRLLADRREE